MNENEFMELVRREVRGDASPDEEAFLRENLDRWRDALVSILQSVDDQFTTRRTRLEEAHGEASKDWPNRREDYFAERARFNSWRSSAVTFKRHVVARIQEIKRSLRTRNRSELDERRLLRDALFDVLVAESSSESRQIAEHALRKAGLLGRSQR